MRTWLALAVALAGCHGPAVFECLASADCHDVAATGTCEPSGFCSFADGSCASGRRYDATAGMELADTCVPPEPDSDGDGVADALDNCKTVANALQDNEDGDRFGDACDPCPAFADGQPVADLDADGLADRCDPHTDVVAADHVVVFEGFAHGIPPTWTATTWTESGGAIDAAGDGTVTVTPPATIADTYAIVQIDVQTFGAAAGMLGLTMAGVECVLTETSPGLGQKLALRTEAGGNFSSIDFAYSPGTSYVLIEHWDHATGWDCSAQEIGGSPVTISGGKGPPGGDAGVVGKGTLAGTVPFVLVVGR